MNVVVDEEEFPLPIKVYHRFSGLSDNCLFHGRKAETKQNRVQSLQVELLGEISPMKGLFRVLLFLLSSLLLLLVELSLMMNMMMTMMTTRHYMTVDDSKLEIDTYRWNVHCNHHLDRKDCQQHQDKESIKKNSSVTSCQSSIEEVWLK
jgi:hypothetical protein